VDSAIKTGEGYSVRSSDTLGKNMVYYCKKFDNVLVRIAVFTSSEWTIYGQALPTVVWFLVVDALVCLIFTYLATNFIIKPIEELTKQAQNGDKITSKYEELQPIAELLNRQNENIKQKIERIEEEKSEVERAKESKDELVANITHEMNTPLTSIKGFSELLLGEGLSEEQRVRAVSIIREQSERLSNLIATVIHYSEIDSDDLPSYDVDFSALTKDTLKIFEPDFGEKNISVHTDIAEGVTVFSRQERLTTILTNLIANAIRYNKESGSITVGVSKINGNAVLKVSDTGIGISEENLDKIFSRFFTVDKSHNGKGGGYGLGLAFVKKLCLKSGWTISVESKLDEGTTFTVVF
jgi:two-component system phosphate regulon sensor histidine kinase PhoR